MRRGYTQGMNRIYLIASLACVGIAAGCGSKQPEYVAASSPNAAGTTPSTSMPATDSAQSPATGAPSAAGSQSQPVGGVSMPPGMSVGTGGSLTPTPQLDAKIASLQKSGKDKKALAAAYADRGDKRMMDDPAAPRVKYRAALQDYRSALKYDPSNVQAKANKAILEAIYRKMGRPIPS